QARPAALARARLAAVEGVPPPGGRAGGSDRPRAAGLTILRGPARIRAPRAAGRAPRAGRLSREPSGAGEGAPVMMPILGISAHYHDAAAALVIDGQPVCAVQQERLSRRKSDASFPLEAIEWCLEFAGLEPEQLDAVVFYEKPMLKFERILTMALRGFPRTWRSFPHPMRNSLGEKLWGKGIIASHLGVPGREIFVT